MPLTKKGEITEPQGARISVKISGNVSGKLSADSFKIPTMFSFILGLQFRQILIFRLLHTEISLRTCVITASNVGAITASPQDASVIIPSLECRFVRWFRSGCKRAINISACANVFRE